MAVLECRDVSKYFGEFPALTNVRLSINNGEVLGIVGPNGAGKTTLFNVITGYLKPDTGQVIFQGEQVHKLKPHQIFRRGIARTYQITQCFDTLSVLGNMLVAAHYGGISSNSGSSREGAREHCLRILEFLGLSDKAGVPGGVLSLYYKKLLMIGTALAVNPRLLLLDEPLAGLNPAEIRITLQLVKEVNKTGVTLGVIEHNMRELMNVSSRMIFLSHGQSIAEGTPSEIASNPRVIEEYVGMRIGGGGVAGVQ